MRWGTRPAAASAMAAALNELAQHPVMVQLGVVQVEMAGVAQQRGLPVQVDTHIAQLTRYRRLPGLQQQLAALLMGKAGALQKVGHPLEPLRPLARRQGSARRRGQNRRPRVARGLGRRVMAVSELAQPCRFRPGRHVIHHSVQVGQMPAGGQHGVEVVGWHVALLSQSIQDAQHSPLGEIGPSRRRHQVNQLRQTLTVSGGAPAMTAAEPTGAVSAISAMAHGGLPGETGANDRTWSRQTSLTVIAEWYSMYCERWGGWDTSPVTN